MTRKPIDPDAVPTLSPQQKSALWLFACGNTVEQVASIMMIANATAKEHLHRAYRSLHARNGVNAVHLAYQLGFFEAPHVREEIEANEATITDLRQQLDAERETIRRASAGLSGRTVLTGQQIQMIKDVARQARNISGESDLRLRALQHDLGSIAGILEKLLREVGETVVEDRVQEAARALDMSGIPNVSQEFISLVLDAHPDIERLVDEWNWSGEPVRAKVTEYVIRDMLGLNEREYEGAVTHRPMQLLQDFWAAHSKWN